MVGGPPSSAFIWSPLADPAGALYWGRVKYKRTRERERERRSADSEQASVLKRNVSYIMMNLN